MSQSSLTTTTAPLLEVRDLARTFNAVRAVDGLSFSLKEGQTVGLIGPNGSGKSTTMKIILALLRPRSGDVLLKGRSTLRLRTSDIIRQGVASVPEARHVFPEMTVEENLFVGAYLRRGRSAIRQDLQRMYELFPRLAERRRQHAGTLSGGEQQMLAFARSDEQSSPDLHG